MSANATGTPTSQFLIPKVNTASDSPNGKGINEMMDAIDVLLNTLRSVTVAGNVFLSNRLLTADAQPAFDVRGNGKIEWGAGGASAVDSNLYRVSPGVIKTDGELITGGAVLVSPVAAINAFLYNPPSAIGVIEVGTLVQGEANFRHYITDVGTMVWGAGGASTTDTNLYRNGIGVLKTDGSIQVGLTNLVGGVPKTTTSTLAGGPPGSPGDGDIWIATAVDANGTRWQFQYNAGSASAFKWEFIGGAPMTASINTDESTATTGAWADLGTVGPKVTVARGGDYICTGMANLYSTVASNDFLGITSGAGTPSFPLTAENSLVTGYAGNLGSTVAIAPGILTGVTGGNDIRLRYFYGAATGHAGLRSIAVYPVRVS